MTTKKGMKKAAQRATQWERQEVERAISEVLEGGSSARNREEFCYEVLAQLVGDDEAVDEEWDGWERVVEEAARVLGVNIDTGERA